MTLPDSVVLAAYIEQASALQGLPVAAAYRDGVLVHLTVSAQMAELVMDFVLPDEAGIASVFVP